MKGIDFWSIGSIITLISFLFMEGCSVKNQKSSMNNINVEQLVKYITQEGYHGLF